MTTATPKADQGQQDPSQAKEGAGRLGGGDSPHPTDLPPAEGQQDSQEPPKTYSEDYVKSLRDEAAGHRVRAKDRDVLADRLVVALAAADGRLADPDDLPRSAELLAEITVENITAAVGALLARKPHLASRRPTGDAQQGARTEEPSLSLSGLLRGA